MGLKSIEMQVALPRTQDAAKLQEASNQRAFIVNSQANISVQREDQLKRTTVRQKEEMHHVGLKKEHAKKEGSFQDKRQDQSPENEPKETKHPYKGKFIDYSG